MAWFKLDGKMKEEFEGTVLSTLDGIRKMIGTKTAEEISSLLDDILDYVYGYGDTIEDAFVERAEGIANEIMQAA